MVHRDKYLKRCVWKQFHLREPASSFSEFKLLSFVLLCFFNMLWAHYTCSALVASWRSTTRRCIQLCPAEVQGVQGLVLHNFWGLWRCCDAKKYLLEDFGSALTIKEWRSSWRMQRTCWLRGASKSPMARQKCRVPFIENLITVWPPTCPTLWRARLYFGENLMRPGSSASANPCTLESSLACKRTATSLHSRITWWSR